MVAYGAPIARYQVNGSLGQGEVFSFGINVGLVSEPANQAAAQALTDQVRTVVATNLLPVAVNYISTDATFDGVKGYFYATGLSSADFIATSSFTTGRTGTGTGSNPLQTSIVVTTQTAANTRRGRGRMYLPLTALPLTAHELTSAQTTALVNAVRATFIALQTSTPAQPPVVLSPTTGSFAAIIAVRADSRTDVQRRRAGRETVLYTASATTP